MTHEHFLEKEKVLSSTLLQQRLLTVKPYAQVHMHKRDLACQGLQLSFFPHNSPATPPLQNTLVKQRTYHGNQDRREPLEQPDI